MKTKDFERAILALGAGIVIDEMKMRHADVRQVNGHTDTLLIVWDEHGRGFSASKESKSDTFFTEDEEGVFVEKRGVSISRDASFDLKFE